MKRIIRYFQGGWAAWAVLLLLVSACSKGELAEFLNPGDSFSYTNNGPDHNDLAIGTVRSQDGIRYIRLDARTACLIVNPDEVKSIPDGTRVFLQYRCVVLNTPLPEFCSDAILLEWADPLNVGEVRTEPQDRVGDPMSLILDWITCLEDGFVTLHYAVPSKGSASHGFCLCPGKEENEYRLIHDAHGDNEGDLSDGLICFDVSALLPDTGGKTVTLSLTYLNLDKTSKTLTVDYRSPQ